MRSLELRSIHLLKVNFIYYIAYFERWHALHGATKKAISFLIPKWIQRQIETRQTFVEPFRALWETEREKERPPFNTAHMNGDGGGMTLGKALSKHYYTTNTT